MTPEQLAATMQYHRPIPGKPSLDRCDGGSMRHHGWEPCTECALVAHIDELEAALDQARDGQQTFRGMTKDGASGALSVKHAVARCPALDGSDCNCGLDKLKDQVKQLPVDQKLEIRQVDTRGE